MDLGQYEDAIKDYERTCKIDKSKENKQLLSDAKLALNKRAKILKKKIEEGNSAFKNSRFQDALNLYTEALNVDQSNKKDKAKLYFSRATVHLKLNQLTEAVADCTAALELDENYLTALLRRAKCYMDLGEYEDAVKDYERACKIDNSKENKQLLSDAKLPSNNTMKAECHFNRASVYSKINKLSEAVADCNAALEFNKYYLKALLCRAKCYVDLGEYEDAVKDYERACKIDNSEENKRLLSDAKLPSNNTIKAQSYLLQATGYFEQNKLPEAVAACTNALEFNEYHLKALLCRAKCHMDLGEYEHAIEDYERACKIDESQDNKRLLSDAKLTLNNTVKAQSYFLQATGYLEQNKLPEAVEACTVALEFNEYHLKALLCRAKCYMDLGKYEDAVKDYQRACKVDYSIENTRLLSDALILTRRKGYYKILGVERTATAYEIQKAYRERADAIIKEQEKKLKKLDEAYGILSHVNTKGEYDDIFRKRSEKGGKKRL